MLLVSDIHDAPEALARVADSGEPVLILGDLLNFIDYRTGEGIVAEVLGRDFARRVADARGFWGYLFPLLVVMSSSLAYELVEWGAAVVFGGELGMAYLGTQGDIWDAHKDSLLATGGALVATVVIAVVHASLDRDFGREWAQSLTVKNSEPLGEVAIGRYLNERENAP